jgi:hypothetical protein
MTAPPHQIIKLKGLAFCLKLMIEHNRKPQVVSQDRKAHLRSTYIYNNTAVIFLTEKLHVRSTYVNNIQGGAVHHGLILRARRRRWGGEAVSLNKIC